MSTREPRSGTREAPGSLRVEVGDLLDHPGRSRDFHCTGGLADDVGTSVVSVPAGTALEVTGRIDALRDSLWVSGTAAAVALSECSRCLDPLTITVRARFEDEFADRPAERGRRPAGGSSAGGPRGGTDEDIDLAEDDPLLVEGTTIDLTPVVRDAIALALPRYPVCAPTCPGLCAQCGIRLADAPDHSHDRVDPRWAALTSFMAPEGAGLPAPEGAGPEGGSGPEAGAGLGASPPDPA